ncbi:CO/xanthine dehydrogenase FAD-binding subunit [Kribbella amoyensis]|uniref:CO/xanthine dehydrogenase FAD-binding subunit n=1 Tax=Kribbella amoyensis TaxID=996641 RepID=A0A561B2P8_9ACTN|nr:xanthine dehydrogenase family protein subunit M [Kribbella amoyensis]TWD73135.1 CO/xanthine dehydrogenase FAD-binding subunit [Kribbella amoyensis]
MDFLTPVGWDEALELKASAPDALPITGGTDVMVELNLTARRPTALLDLTRIAAARQWSAEDGFVRLGAGVSYRRVIDEVGALLPGLAMAARTVGSPQIRNRGTVGGNLGAASPAGDSHPPLLATGAEVEAASVRGVRRIPIDDFFTGVKRNALAPDELITAVVVPISRGPQQFSKIGPRNAMVIAVCSFALALDPQREVIGTGIGSAAPTPIRAAKAEAFLTGELRERDLWHRRGPLPESVVEHFAGLVAAAAAPIDDVRGTAAYRRHALSVLARRTVNWAWDDYWTTGRAAA